MAEVIIAFIVGLLIGMLGSGGAIIAIPAFIFFAGYPAMKASSSALMLVFLSSLVALFGHWKNRRINVRDVVVFAPLGIVGAFGGTALNRGISETVLLALFVGVLYLAGLSLLVKDRIPKRFTKHHDSAAGKRMLLVGCVGVVFGFLTGLLGVGGGFLIVPLLVVVFGYDMKIAVGTSVAVIAINSVSSLFFRIGDFELTFSEILPLVISALAGVAIGLFFHTRINENKIQQAFSILLLVLATYSAIDLLMGV